MPETQAQTYESHTRMDPTFHYFLAPVALINVVLAIYNLTRHFTFVDSWLVILAIAFLVAVFKIRLYSLKVQDRVIRLEERLRLERVLSDSPARTGELSVAQLVALRFAPDGELAALVEQTLANGWDQKQIKKAIRNWQVDDFRV
ncbi:MAG: hypothetical protein JWO80_4740 [Bryobacterales bacterium]|nr:hypothetical protein [Bryobacterales bacterium]